ncbi:MAG: hypothetical protein R3C42_07700 [Parvularculaceae bacterium]
MSPTCGRSNAPARIRGGITLGGLLSPLDGIGPNELNIGTLLERASSEAVKEIVLALPATVDARRQRIISAISFVGECRHNAIGA